MKTKKIKVRYSNRSWGTHYSGGSSTNPCISMEGKWLDEIGFHIGDQIQVDFEEGLLIIRPVHEKPAPTMVAESTEYKAGRKRTAKAK